MFDSKDFSLIQQIYSFEVSVGSVTERERERERVRERGHKMPQLEVRKVTERKTISNKGQTNKSRSILTHLKDLKTKLEKDKNSDDEKLNTCGNCGVDISKQRYYKNEMVF